jgi:hypothetical protein
MERLCVCAWARGPEETQLSRLAYITPNSSHIPHLHPRLQNRGLEHRLHFRDGIPLNIIVERQRGTCYSQVHMQATRESRSSSCGILHSTEPFSLLSEGREDPVHISDLSLALRKQP